MRKPGRRAVLAAVLRPAVAFALYILFNLLASLFVADSMTISLVADVFMCAVFGMAFFMELRSGERTPHEDRVRFSLVGWFVILIVFAAMYVTSESLGNYVYYNFPAGSEAYTELTSQQLYTYVLMATTVGPFAEELLFRWFAFRKLRDRVPFWWACVLSSIWFTASHMSLMHIPVTMALSLFLCVLYEVTGQFRYCVVFHILFNFVGATFLFVIDVHPAVMLLAYLAVMAVIVLSYVFRERVFGKYLKAGGLAQFEAWLDENRKHFGDSDKRD